MRLIDRLKSNEPSARSGALSELYFQKYPSIEKYVVKNSGSIHDAQDVFQDGIVVLYEQIQKNNFKEEASVYTYLFSICKNIWLMNLRKKKQRRFETLENLNELKEEPGVFVEVANLKTLLSELKSDCLQLLTSFYYQKTPLAELMEDFALSSVQVAKNKKLRCMKKLMAIVKNKGLKVEDFIG